MRSKANREISGRVISKGVARIEVIERAVHGAPLPELNKVTEESASDRIFRQTGVALTGSQARAYLKMLANQESNTSKEKDHG